MLAALADQIFISNLHKIGIQHLRVLAVQSIVQNPRNIFPVNDPENKSLLGRQTIGHGGDSDIASSYAKRVAKQS